jgi:hypothetical protein
MHEKRLVDVSIFGIFYSAILSFGRIVTIVVILVVVVVVVAVVQAPLLF